MLLVESEMSACWREARWLICEWQANRVLSEMPIGGSRQIWNLDWLQPTLYVTDKLQNFDLDRVIISFNFYHNRNTLQWITLDCIQWHWLMCKGHAITRDWHHYFQPSHTYPCHNCQAKWMGCSKCNIWQNLYFTSPVINTSSLPNAAFNLLCLC